jgi:hypothetical protein
MSTGERIEDVFTEAVGMPAAEERAAFLDRSCAGEPDLRPQVEALLRANDRGAGFLEMPFVDAALEEIAASDTKEQKRWVKAFYDRVAKEGEDAREPGSRGARDGPQPCER